MTSTVSVLLERFASLRVAVLGEAMIDTYLDGSTERLCPEAPVPIVALSERADLPGGAANTAANAGSLGGQVEFLTVIGDDADGALIRSALEDHGISSQSVITEMNRRTLSRQRVMAGSQLLLRLDQGSTGLIGVEAEQALIDRLCIVFPRSDVVIVSDYRYGVVTPRVLRAIADLQTQWSRALVVDSRRLNVFRDIGVTAVKPNYTEAMGLLGCRALEGHHGRVDGVCLHGERLLDLTGAQFAAVTLDSEGTLVLERNRPAYRIYARATRTSCVAGAGDTFTAALALALGAGATAVQAAELASSAAEVVVSKDRTSTCFGHELREEILAQGKYLIDRTRLAARVAHYRQQGRRIVFTNGCFDILHRGHITFLHRAKTLGDVLIVGINSDAAIRRLKGPERPINALEDRVQVLAALSCIDLVVPFEEDTPDNLIRILRPHVFAKGGDYTRDRLPESTLVEVLGGKVQILPYIQDRSTTSLIERIQEMRARSRSLALRTKGS